MRAAGKANKSGELVECSQAPRCLAACLRVIKTHPFKVYVDRELRILLGSLPLEKSAAFPWSLNIYIFSFKRMYYSSVSCDILNFTTIGR